MKRFIFIVLCILMTGFVMDSAEASEVKKEVSRVRLANEKDANMAVEKKAWQVAIISGVQRGEPVSVQKNHGKIIRRALHVPLGSYLNIVEFVDEDFVRETAMPYFGKKMHFNRAFFEMIAEKTGADLVVYPHIDTLFEYIHMRYIETVVEAHAYLTLYVLDKRNNTFVSYSDGDSEYDDTCALTAEALSYEVMEKILERAKIKDKYYKTEKK